MTNAYNSQDGDTLYIPSVGEMRNFIVKPKPSPSGRFDLTIIASTESKDELVDFFKAQQKQAAKDRCFVTATHRDGTSLELAVTEVEIRDSFKNGRFALIATMENRDICKSLSIVQGIKRI